MPWINMDSDIAVPRDNRLSRNLKPDAAAVCKSHGPSGCRKAGLSSCMRFPVLLIPLVSGCVAVSTTVGVREPDPAKIEHATHRAEVEKLLGKPLWQPGVHNGLTYEIYQYKAAKPPNPALGAFALGMDYITLGMLEYAMSDVKQFTPVKQVAVAYADQDRVRSVSRSWYLDTAEPCRRMRSSIPKDAGIPPDTRPLAQSKNGNHNSKHATLKWKKEIRMAVDGRNLDGEVLNLRPGRHKLAYSSELGGSVMYGSMIQSYEETFTDIELLAGRTYEMKRKRFYPGVGTRVDIFWLEDIGNRETLACSWK